MNAPRPALGRIEWLDIRAVWPHETADFTPWLLGNVEALAEALGLELELEQAEHSVGGFSLDLIGRDLTHGARLIVENQIEQSDHGHLGQLLTYAAGTDAETIAWVARSFRDEHRVALDWLNEQTGEGIRFFGIVVRALKIDDSRPAPHFEVVVKPNDWQKTVRKTAAVADSSQHEAYRSFWAPLREAILQETPALLAGRAEPKSFWLTLNSPIPRTWIQGEIGAGELRIVLDVDMGDRAANLAMLEQLKERRAHLEAAPPLASRWGNGRSGS